MLENAIAQWRRGEKRVSSAPEDRRAVLERVVSGLVAELRRRLGGRFTTAELADLYARDTAWCLPLAMRLAPEKPWAWEAGLVIDSAFARYAREAADYAG